MVPFFGSSFFFRDPFSPGFLFQSRGSFFFFFSFSPPSPPEDPVAEFFPVSVATSDLGVNLCSWTQRLSFFLSLASDARCWVSPPSVLPGMAGRPSALPAGTAGFSQVSLIVFLVGCRSSLPFPALGPPRLSVSPPPLLASRGLQMTPQKQESGLIFFFNLLPFLFAKI